MTQGKDLILSLNGTAIAAAKSGSISVDTSFINIASPVDGAWENVKPTTHKWTAHTDGLVSDPKYVDSLLQMQIDKTPLTLRFSMAGSGSRQGTCYIAHIEQTGSVGNLAKYSIDLQGSGALCMSFEFEDILQSAADQWIAYTGQELEIKGQDHSRTVLAVAITLSTPRKIVVAGSGAWGISADSVFNIDYFFHNSDERMLNALMYASGDSEGRISLPAGSFTLLKNNFENVSMALE